GFVQCGDEVLELLAGVVPLGEPGGAEGHAERVSAGVAAAADRCVDLAGECLQFAGAAEVHGDFLAERVTLGAFEPGQLGVGFGLVHEQGVPGGQGLDLAVGQGGVTDVLDFADVEASPHDLGDEPCFAFDGLPHVAVEAAFGDVAEDLHFVVVVALAQDAALALGDVGGPPRAVEVVQGDGAELDVGPDAHFLGAAEQDGDGPGAAGGEQLAFVPVGFRFVHEPDGVPGYAAGGELVAEFVVDVPVVAGGADVAEDQLQAAADGGGLPVGAWVDVVAVGLPQVRDPGGCGADLAGDGHGPAEEPQVQGGLAAVHADLEHVVLFGHHLPLADRVGAVAEFGHHVELAVAGLADDGFRGALAVGGTLGQGRDGQLEVFGGLDVGGDVPAPEHLRDVGEPGEPGFLPE